MRTLHGILDVNNDGVISYDDFKMLANKFSALGHLKPDAEKEFNEVLQRIWETQWGEISPYNLINAEQYLTEMHHAINDSDLRDKIHNFLPYLFKVMEIATYLNTYPNKLAQVIFVIHVYRRSIRIIPVS